jgi:molecular chaperone GrpE
MTKHKDDSTHQADSKPEEGSADTSVAVSAEETAALLAQLAEAGAKAEEYRDALQRERADFTNYRRRMELENASMGRLATGTAIKKFLPVMDDLERALAHRPAGDTWAEGIELVHRKFQSILDAEGVTRIDAKGKPFDPNLHEAIMQEPSTEYEPGTVIDVLQQGYIHGERVLRPALVKVAQ